MSYKQSILNSWSSVKKHKEQSIAASEPRKDVSKYYKAINFSLSGLCPKNNENNLVKPTYIRPFRVMVLKFNTPESSESHHSVDVSSVFNKPPKMAILKHSKKIKISKQFAHWVEPYTLLKKQHMGLLPEFCNIHDIVGSDINIYEYELYINSNCQKVILTKHHISNIVAQTLCNTQYSNGVYQLSYTQHSGVMGAFILKNINCTNFYNSATIYYISDYELKQCALSNFANKRVVEFSKWENHGNNFISNQATEKFAHLLGNTLTSSEQIRSSLLGGLVSNSLISNLQSIISLSVLNRYKSPLHRLAALLTHRQAQIDSF
uniref:Uncharacterized protein n=1 Tax=Ulva pertusa TaxID=3120 RepID=A0A222AIH4_ULVPE|nr:hypothetical protein [Ulva pertusa]ASO76170.1 hypothetical protein [Ulva pertusa]ASO76212.1 hypothetical protein [Ulva pertusa]